MKRLRTITSGMLDWLDGRPAWLFVTVLYLTRWVAIGIVAVILPILFSRSQLSEAAIPSAWKSGNPLGLFLGLVVIPPFLETLVECSLPYWVVSLFRRDRAGVGHRRWSFVLVSALVMAVLHPIPAAVMFAFVTGAFLAYNYAHFAPAGIAKAILTTTLFHSAINLVGWTMIVMG